ncbi:hypothetical protein SBOR_4367 [Sclerotinia borealis F-4128]|uniref:Uncharacterized protein n=1 Tax=Sclerotinia borealis (strain F-4128) TaxID=1432307 RepID=W9CL72_SCLBF|nr:hypothetical protein SBOR_4367 [Sclerotinia borealis F-4128]
MAVSPPSFQLSLATGTSNISIPDFEGRLASFGAGIAAGHATLDSIRFDSSRALSISILPHTGRSCHLPNIRYAI